MENRGDISKGFGSRLTDFELGYMKGLHEMKMKPVDIAEKMNISTSTVYNMIKCNFLQNPKAEREPVLDSDEEYDIV